MIGDKALLFDGIYSKGVSTSHSSSFLTVHSLHKQKKMQSRYKCQIIRLRRAYQSEDGRIIFSYYFLKNNFKNVSLT